MDWTDCFINYTNDKWLTMSSTLACTLYYEDCSSADVHTRLSRRHTISHCARTHTVTYPSVHKLTRTPLHLKPSWRLKKKPKTPKIKPFRGFSDDNENVPESSRLTRTKSEYFPMIARQDCVL